MTRRNITTVLGSLLVGLLVALNAPAVSADGPCYTDGQGNCAVTTPRTATFSSASAGPAVAVPGIDYRFIEENSTTLPSAEDTAVQTAPRETSCTMVPAPCLMP